MKHNPSMIQTDQIYEIFEFKLMRYLSFPDHKILISRGTLKKKYKKKKYLF